MQAAHHRAPRHTELPRGVTVRPALEVDENDDVAETVGERGELAARRSKERAAPGVGRSEGRGHRPGARVRGQALEGAALATATAPASDEDAEEDLQRPCAQVRPALVLRSELQRALD